MLTTHTANSKPKTEPLSLRRFVVLCLLPFSLLVVAGPLAERFVPQASFQTSSTMTQVENAADELVTARTGINRAVREAHRRAAWETIKRLESEARLSGSVIYIAPADLKRLRNAIR